MPRVREHVGDEIPLMYDGSAAFDLPDAVYLGHALGDAGYLWYEEPIREFSVTAYKWLGDRVRVPLCVAETSDGVHLNTADFIASGAASFVRTSAELRGGITGAMRIAHLADAFRLRAEVHGMGNYSQHLCMAIPNTTYYESLVMSTQVTREAIVDADGLVHAPVGTGLGLPQAPTTPVNSVTWSSTPCGRQRSCNTREETGMSFSETRSSRLPSWGRGRIAVTSLVLAAFVLALAAWGASSGSGATTASNHAGAAGGPLTGLGGLRSACRSPRPTSRRIRSCK